MKKILFLFFFTVFGEVMIAQKLYQDKIYLKNGEIIRGVLITEVLNISAKIVNQKGDTLTFQMDDIQKLTREKIQKSSALSKDQWLKPGYELTLEVAKAISVGEFGINYFQADVINGVRLNSFLSAGFGIGLTYMNDAKYTYYQRPKIIIPVYLDLRFNYPPGKKISPYLTFDFGGSLSRDKNYIEDKYSTDFIGVFLKSSLGTHMHILKNISLNLAVGYRSQKMPFIHILYPERNSNGIHTDLNFSNSVNIIGGITF